MSNTNQSDIILDKVLKSKTQLNPEDVEPVKKETKPLDDIAKIAAEYKEFGVDWTEKEPVDKAAPREDPITVMFNKARKGTF